MDYKKMYLLLLDASLKAVDLLVDAHQKAEALYMEHNETALELEKPETPDKQPRSLQD